MNRESVIELLPDKLKNIQIGEEGSILRGEYFFNDALVAVYYIDFTTEEINSEIGEYLEKYISSDYYNNPGHLQWNYYLIFLRDAQHINKETKNVIEKNDIYARKFVFTAEELKNYFEYKRSDKAVDVDIVSLWKEKLREVDLYEVYAHTTYTDAVPRFIMNTVLREEISENSSGHSNKSFIIKKLSTLEFTNEYRPYPNQRNFSFGTANLIKGVNGSGKTSLLEGIELIIAGKNYKDSSYMEPNNCISTYYNDNPKQIDSYTPSDNQKYRTRDIHWYASGYKTGNELHIAFNKYNFYDSDAAYHLSYDSDISSLSKYLSSIALGSEFIRIQDRLKGFNERLAKELRDRNRIILEEEQSKNGAQKTLTALKSSSDPLTNFNLFIEYSKEIKWLGDLPQTLGDKSDSFEADFLTLQSDINALNQLISSIKLSNSKSWDNELEKIKQFILTYKNSKQEIQQLNAMIREREESSKEDNFKIPFLNQAEPFYNNNDSFQLLGMGQRISTLTANISKYNRALEQLEGLKDNEILLSNEIFSEYKIKSKEQNNALKTKVQRISDEIEAMKVNLNKLETIITEIKSYGKQYIVLNSEATSCPLCDTPYSFGELSERISKISDKIKENVAIDILNGQLIEASSQIEKSNLLIRNIDVIENAIAGLLPISNYANLKLSEISQIFNSANSTLEIDKSELLKESSLKLGLQEKGLSENQFNIVKNNIETHSLGLSFDIESKEEFIQLLQKTKENIERFNNLNIEDQEKIKNLESNFNEKVKGIINAVPFESLELELEYKKSTLEKGLGYFTKIKKLLSFSEIDDINDIRQNVNKLYTHFEKYRKTLTEQGELHLANQILEQADKRINALKPQIERLNSALEVINDILTNYSETRILGEFMQNNEEQIQEIFENIHSPKEFSKIFFNYSSNTVVLKRKISDQDVPLTKISSGQRSALALSIFIALNKKLKNGPNIIMFDDPVTYTDDLNTLAFLDYLRELIIHESRQLIFSTANLKLASLFEKKFAFLGENEFKVFPLERND